MKQLVTSAVMVFTLISSGSSQQCPARENGYLADPTQCDAYYECRDGAPEYHLCPEGLLFNDRLTGYPRYPCSYPQEVDCGSRTKLQPSSPSGDCPHQYGLFKVGGNGLESCTSFLSCVEGKSFLHQCPEGLAFNGDTYECDWPDKVPGCEQTFTRSFQCPGGSGEQHARFSDPEDCRKFYVCIANSKPRLLSCGIGTVFNPDLGVCDDPSKVPNCANYYPSEVLRALEVLRAYDSNLSF